MIDARGALETVIRHAVQLEGDYDEIAPTLTALADCGDRTLVPRLSQALDAFLDEGNFYGRDLIAGVLAAVQGQEALPALLRASARDLGDDQDGLQADIGGLLTMDKTAARSMVLEFVTGETPEMRRTGLWALGYVADEQDVEILAAAATDPDPQVRSIAIGSIDNPAHDDRAFRVLLRALSDIDEQVRVSAASRLGYTRRPDAVAPLVELASDLSSRVRSMVAYALGRLGHEAAKPALLALLHDADRHVRERAVEALGSVGGTAAVDALIAVAIDQDSRLRVQAAKSLPKAIGSDPRAAEQIRVLARDSEASVRAATLSGLASADGASSQWAPLLHQMEGDPDPMVRQRVAVVARHLAPNDARRILRGYADDPDQTVRRIAATELARLTDSPAC